MTWTKPQAAIFAIGILHSVFMAGELVPWGRPLIMGLVLDKRKPISFGEKEYRLLTSVVHNAGVYNGIVAAGLFATLWAGPGVLPVQVALLTGGVVAGLFGAATLTWETIGQAVFGTAALGIVLCLRA